MQWYKVDTPTRVQRVVDAWAEAPVRNLETLGLILGVARNDVLAYAPAQPADTDPENPPDNLVLAQLMQAKNLLAAGTVSSAGDIGEGAFVFTPRPMDKTIKGIIRPRIGRPRAF